MILVTLASQSRGFPEDFATSVQPILSCKKKRGNGKGKEEGNLGDNGPIRADERD